MPQDRGRGSHHIARIVIFWLISKAMISHTAGHHLSRHDLRRLLFGRNKFSQVIMKITHWCSETTSHYVEDNNTPSCSVYIWHDFAEKKTKQQPAVDSVSNLKRKIRPQVSWCWTFGYAKPSWKVLLIKEVAPESVLF